MHWVIQEDLLPETGLTELRRVLSRFGLPHSFHRVPPGEGRLEPDVSPQEGRVFVVGGYTLCRIAQERGWAPGALPVPGFLAWAPWANHLLNLPAWEAWSDSLEGTFMGGPRPPFFCRPMEDSKKFTGRVFQSHSELQKAVRGHDPIHLLISTVKEIHSEVRVWVVGKKPVAWSSYKIGSRVCYNIGVSDKTLEFAAGRAHDWSPAPAYVMDIADTPDGLKIVEINNINAAGLYGANVGALVMALEDGLG